MVEFLHDGNLLLDEVQRIVLFRDRVPMQRGVEAQAGRKSTLPPPPCAGAAQQVRLGALTQARFGEFFNSLRLSCQRGLQCDRVGDPHRSRRQGSVCPAGLVGWFLTYSCPYWSTARWTAPKDPRPISCLIKYWLMRCWAVPSSSLLLYSERALSVSYGRVSAQSSQFE